MKIVNQEFEGGKTKPYYTAVKKDEKPKLTACPVCHGMGVRERPNGETFDCPNRSCNNGFVKTN